jgi:hypothetical protein
MTEPEMEWWRENKRQVARDGIDCHAIGNPAAVSAFS